MRPQLNIALRAARSAGELIMRAYEDERFEVISKGDNDFVTHVDRKAEAIIIDTLQKSYPEYSILSEEAGLLGNPHSEFQWIIDPLDGTTNFIHGIPQFAVSIALRRGNTTEMALVYDPLKNEEFSAIRGEGAKLNNKRMRVSDQKQLSQGVIGTGFPFHSGHQSFYQSYLAMLESIIKESVSIRRMGAATLDLAYVAAGRFDGFWELALKSWDMAAGALLITESGGLVSDLKGSNQYLQEGHIVAGNPKVFKALLQKLQPFYQAA